MALVCLNVFDGDFRQIAEVSHGWRCDEPGVIVVPIDHPAAKWIIAHGEPASCVISIRWNGTNFGGVLENFECVKSGRGDEVLRATFSSVGFGELTRDTTMTDDQSNRIALAENLVTEAEARVVRAENELLAAQVGCDAAHQRLQSAREAAQAFIKGAVT